MPDSPIASNFNVFVSYADHDAAHADALSRKIRELGADVKCWVDSKVPGKPAWNTIQGWIDNADAVVVVISKDTLVESSAVSQEIGYAKGKSKFIVPLVGPGVQPGKLAMVMDLTYIPWDGLSLDEATKKLQPSLAQLSESKQAKGWLLLGALALVGVALCFPSKK